MDKQGVLAGKSPLDFLRDSDPEVDRETRRNAEPEGVPTRLAKQFGFVFLSGVVVSGACIVIGFLLGYNARPSKSGAMEIPQTLINSRAARFVRVDSVVPGAHRCQFRAFHRPRQRLC